MKSRNHVKELREARMLGKNELAKLAGVSPLTMSTLRTECPAALAANEESSWRLD
jgi:DNA-binding XRE family transcriptional regulator